MGASDLASSPSTSVMMDSTLLSGSGPLFVSRPARAAGGVESNGSASVAADDSPLGVQFITIWMAKSVVLPLAEEAAPLLLLALPLPSSLRFKVLALALAMASRSIADA